MPRPLKIQMVFRTPVGGLFRHVRDLVRGLSEEGHQTGIICDLLTGGEGATAALAEIEKYCPLGVSRIPVSRLPGFGDVSAARHVARIAGKSTPDLIHGHGAKGGLYARLAGRSLGIPSIYVPHGGSLHYNWSSPSGAIFLATEKLIRPLGSGLHFVCAFERDQFAEKIGLGRTPARVIHNGLWPEEFEPVVPAANSTDIVYVGELRMLKGVDVLIKAIAIARATRPITATIVGEGPDRRAFEGLTRELELDRQITFTGALPARTAFARGRTFVMPSRAELFPYVILEATAAQLPVIASRVGGIPELLPESNMVNPDDPQELASAILRQVAVPQGAILTQNMRDHLDCRRMTRDVCKFYLDLT